MIGAPDELLRVTRAPDGLLRVTRALDDLLRARGRFAVGHGRVPVAAMLGLLAASGFAYGLAMGSFAGRPLQALYAGLKVPLLLTFSTAVCLPSFFVANALLGLRDDFAAALRGVLAAQATVAATLLGLLPVIVFVYVSTDVYRHAVLANGVMFLLATLAGQVALARHYAPLERSNPRHVIARRAWVVLYVFVAVQLAWVLRPFIGDPHARVAFLRDDAWSNAYVIVLRDVLRLYD